MAAVIRFSHESASAKLTIWDEKSATLGNVYSIKPQRGHGNGLLQKVVSHADRSGLTLLLEVQQYGTPRGLTNDGLKAWYKKFGFVDCGRNLMRRPPSQDLQAS